LGLLNFPLHKVGLLGSFFAFTGGTISCLAGVNVRPIIINVNSPEVRGAALTASNLVINFGRGIGPVFLSTTCGIFGVDRRTGFNALLISFWMVTTILMLFLSKSLPHDQDKMEGDLADYALSLVVLQHHDEQSACSTPASVYSIEDRMSTFDTEAALATCEFLGIPTNYGDAAFTLSPRKHCQYIECPDDSLDIFTRKHRRKRRIST